MLSAKPSSIPQTWTGNSSKSKKSNNTSNRFEYRHADRDQWRRLPSDRLIPVSKTIFRFRISQPFSNTQTIFKGPISSDQKVFKSHLIHPRFLKTLATENPDLPAPHRSSPCGMGRILLGVPRSDNHQYQISNHPALIKLEKHPHTTDTPTPLPKSQNSNCPKSPPNTLFPKIPPRGSP